MERNAAAAQVQATSGVAAPSPAGESFMVPPRPVRVCSAGRRQLHRRGDAALTPTRQHIQTVVSTTRWRDVNQSVLRPHLPTGAAVGHHTPSTLDAATQKKECRARFCIKKVTGTRASVGVTPTPFLANTALDQRWAKMERLNRSGAEPG